MEKKERGEVGVPPYCLIILFAPILEQQERNIFKYLYCPVLFRCISPSLSLLRPSIHIKYGANRTRTLPLYICMPFCVTTSHFLLSRISIQNAKYDKYKVLKKRSTKFKNNNTAKEVMLTVRSTVIYSNVITERFI